MTTDILRRMAAQCQDFKMSRRIYTQAMLLYIIVSLYGCRDGVAETSVGSTIPVKVGESVTFPFSAMGNRSYIVHLLFNTIIIATWYPQPFTDVREQYKGRVRNSNESIWLNKLSLSDSGLYKVVIVYTSGKLQQPECIYFHLQVFEPVSKPNITAEYLGNTVSLSCFSSQGTEVTYSWETLPPCGNDSCVHHGQRIDLHVLTPSTYRCTAHNPVSSATSDTIDLEMCSTQQLPAIWIPALCATLIFLVFGALMLLYKRKKQKQCKDERTEADIAEPIMEENPPTTVSSIGPEYVRTLPSARIEYGAVI